MKSRSSVLIFSSSSQKLFDLEIPDKLHGIDLARSMELNIPGRRHAWALMDVSLCGDDYPSTAELLALVRWTLRGMYSQNESINSGIGRQDLTDIFPVCSLCYANNILLIKRESVLDYDCSF